MKVEKQTYNDVTVIQLAGDLDRDYADLFEGTISETISDSPKGIVLDMAKVEFIDSQGLELLVWARDYCNDNRCSLRISTLDENCAKILELTRLDNEFDTYKELTAAVKSFA